jgi:hypothetical protein
MTKQCHGSFAYWDATFASSHFSKLKYKGDGGGDGNVGDMGGPAVRIDTAGNWNNATLYLAEYQRVCAILRLRKSSINRSAPAARSLGPTSFFHALWQG